MGPRILWIGGYGSEKSAHGVGLAAFRRVVETESDGEVEVKINWNIMDERRPNTDLLKLVEDGEMFLCYFSSSYLGGRVPELNVLETPFLFESLESAHQALDGSLGDTLRQAVRTSTGFEVLGFWDNGFRHLTNRLRTVRCPNDCEGMSVRMQPNPIHEELIRSWGGIPVAVELSHAIRLIASLEVDAQENPLANTVAYGVDQVHSHVTMTGHLYGARGLFAHGPTFEALPPQLRQVVEGAVRVAIDEQRNSARDLETSLRVRMASTGTEFVDLTESERNLFVEASSPAIALAHQNVPEELFDLVRS